MEANQRMQWAKELMATEVDYHAKYHMTTDGLAFLFVAIDKQVWRQMHADGRLQDGLARQKEAEATREIPAGDSVALRDFGEEQDKLGRTVVSAMARAVPCKT